MNWKKVKLGEICDINMGKTPSRSNPKYWGEGHCWVSIADLSNTKDNCFIQKTKEQITDLAVKDSGIKVVPKNTLLYSFKLSIGKVAITQIPLFTNEAIVALPIKNEKVSDIKYLYHAIQKVDLTGVGDKAVKGITLNKEKLRILEIPLPDLPTQQYIAQVLDQADALRQQNRQLLAHYDELLQSIFIDMFGDPVKNEKGWEVKRIAEMLSKEKDGTKCGPFGSALKKSDYVSAGIPVWVMDNIISDRFNPNNCLFILEDKYKELKGYSVENGDIIISRAGTVGKMCVVSNLESKSIISTNLIRLSLDIRQLLPIYFITFMSVFKDKVTRLKTGSDGAFTHMNTGIILNIEFPVPPLPLQQQFAQIVEQIEEQKTVVQQSLAESEVLFEGLLAEYFG